VQIPAAEITKRYIIYFFSLIIAACALNKCIPNNIDSLKLVVKKFGRFALASSRNISGLSPEVEGSIPTCRIFFQDLKFRSAIKHKRIITVV